MCSNGKFYKEEDTGLVHMSNNVSTINTALCGGGSPPPLGNHYGLLTCDAGIKTDDGMLGASFVFDLEQCKRVY